MRFLSFSFAVALTVALLVPGRGRGDDSAVREGTALLDEGDRLADQGNSPKPSSATNAPWKSSFPACARSRSSTRSSAT